jgi:hypothetical protein
VDFIEAVCGIVGGEGDQGWAAFGRGETHDSLDLWLKPGTGEWERDVQPGYDFLLELVK